MQQNATKNNQHEKSTKGSVWFSIWNVPLILSYPVKVNKGDRIRDISKAPETN